MEEEKEEEEENTQAEEEKEEEEEEDEETDESRKALSLTKLSSGREKNSSSAMGPTGRVYRLRFRLLPSSLSPFLR